MGSGYESCIADDTTKRSFGVRTMCSNFMYEVAAPDKCLKALQILEVFCVLIYRLYFMPEDAGTAKCQKALPIPTCFCIPWDASDFILEHVAHDQCLKALPSLEIFLRA